MEEADFDDVVDAEEDFGEFEGFADEVFGAGFEGADFVVGLGSDDEDGKVAVGFDGFEFGHDFEAVHAGHLQVEQDE